MPGLMFEERSAWIPAMNVDYHLAVDGLSMTMVVADGHHPAAGVAGLLGRRSVM